MDPAQFQRQDPAPAHRDATRPGRADRQDRAAAGASAGLGKIRAGRTNAGRRGVFPIRQNLELEAFRTETGLPLRTDISLQQTGEASEGMQRDWPAPALGVEKHYGYAFQWFGLSALVLILYVWFQLIAPYRRARLARRG
ncbi:SURF1 family cytochrome oxidase biogenesis protein [Variovorax ureilyticus]|uniref:SURF1 family cytochrome oxidase biogenesis protein n=1 Tax=Variovorax ureilyticus TaxID=1836198 RepID=UPI003D674CA0